MYSYQIKIPKDRVAVLIGQLGETKRIIQRETQTTLTVDSKEGEINIAGEDGLKLFIAQNIIKAVARGFNPEIALRLLKTDWSFEMIDLTNYSTKTNQLQRMKGRVIGQGGKSRRIIEELAECNISVYGKTVAIVAQTETMSIAKRAIEMLLDGANHSTVFKWLERKRRDLKQQRVFGN